MYPNWYYSSPATGLGTRNTYNNVVYEFGKTGWHPVASSGANYSGTGTQGTNTTNTSGGQQIGVPIDESKAGGSVLGLQTTNQNDPNALGHKGNYVGQVVSYGSTPYRWNGAGWDVAETDAQKRERELRDQLQKDVDNEYNTIYGQLDNMEQNVKSGEQNFYDSYTKPFDAQRPLLDQSYNEGLNLNRQQVGTLQQREQSALSDARRLYNELSQGVRQRYGGTNSAGDFANAFYGREFMRQAGGIAQQTGENMKALMDQAVTMKQKYDAQLQSLESQKQAALLQARDAFNQKLQAINNARLETAQNKANLKLQALQAFRNETSNILNQANQYAMQLQAQTQQSTDQLNKSIMAYQAQAATPVNMNNYITPSSPLMGGGQTAQTYSKVNNVSGYYDPNKRKDRFTTQF